MGRILRMLLNEVWKGDKLAIIPADEWDRNREVLEEAGIKSDPAKAEMQSLAFPTITPFTPKFVMTADMTEYVEYNKGSVYNVDNQLLIDRFDTLIPLITVDIPDHLREPYYHTDGKWAFVPLEAYDVKPNGEDLSYMYDVESFYRVYDDAEIRRNVNPEEVPKDGMLVGDLIAIFEAED